jgi:hypothetical protein
MREKRAFRRMIDSIAVAVLPDEASSGSEDQAFDFQTRPAEIEQQAEWKAGCRKIIQALRTMGRIQCFDCLQFNQNRAFNQ